MRLHVRSLAMKEFVLNWLFESVHVQTAVFGTISVKKKGVMSEMILNIIRYL